MYDKFKFKSNLGLDPVILVEWNAVRQPDFVFLHTNTTGDRWLLPQASIPEVDTSIVLIGCSDEFSIVDIQDLNDRYGGRESPLPTLLNKVLGEHCKYISPGQNVVEGRNEVCTHGKFRGIGQWNCGYSMCCHT